WWYVGRTLAYLHPYRSLAVASCVLLLLSVGLNLLGPWPLKILVDHVLQDRQLPPVLDVLLGPLANERIPLLIATIVGGFLIAAADNGVAVLSKYVNTKIEQHMVLDVRSDVFRNTQRMTAE